MRLLIATPLYPPEPGGPATYAKLLEDDFPYPVTVVKFSDVRRYPKLVRHFLYFLEVFRAAKNAEVVLALDPVSVGLPSLWAARLRGRKFVVKVVGDYAWEQGVQRFGINDTLDDFVKRAQVPFAVSMLRAVQTHVAKGADKVIVPSKYLQGIVSAWGVDQSKIEIIYNAITLEEEGNVPNEVTHAARPRIVTIGRLVPWKRIDAVIDAVAQHGTGTLIIVGDGPERGRLEKRVQELPSLHVSFTGALAHRDALAVLADADVFVLNSTYEGLSHVLIEALMLGKPVIATDAGGNGELIEDGKNGVLIPSDSPDALLAALRKVLEEPAFAHRIAAEALTARERFSAAVMRNQTAAVLSTL